MKKLILGLMLMLALQANAQYKYYRDSTYTMPFNFLTGATSVNNGQWWDDDLFVVPLGFDFWLFKDSISAVTISGTGAIVTSTADPDNADYVTGIIAHGSDLVDRDTSEMSSFSPISYVTTGVAPNRICKIEWANAGFYYAMDAGQYTDSINFQLWLYETSHLIEVHYGNGNYVSDFSELYDGGPGAFFGIFDSLDLNSPNAACRVMYNFAGNKNTPHLDSLFSLDFAVPPGVDSSPVAGTVYRFIPKFSGNGGALGYTTVSSHVDHQIDYLQTVNELRMDVFSNEPYQYVLTDINGRMIERGQISRGRKVIHTDQFGSGMYVLKLFSAKENTSFKIIK